MANHVAGRVTRQSGMGVGGSQNLCGVVVEDKAEEISEARGCFGVVPKKLGGAISPCGLLWIGICLEPIIFVEDSDYVGGRVGIYVSRMLSDVVFEGHGESVAHQERPASEGGPYKEMRVATTCAAMASPRPTASTPSLVLAFK